MDRDPISLILGTRFSLILGTRWWIYLLLGTRFEIIGTRIGYLKRLKKSWSYIVSFTLKAASSLGGLQPRWPFVLRSLQFPHAFYTLMYLEVISVLRYNNHDGVIHVCVLKGCISSMYSKCISAIKRILYTTAMYISSSSFVYLCFFFSLLRCMLKV